MRTQLVIGGLMIASTVALVWAGSARADPPPNGMMVSFHLPMIVCEKADYLKALIAAQRTSETAFGAKAKELLAGEKHPCDAGQVSNVVVGESEDAGTVKWGDAEEHLWIVHFGDVKAEHWALYEEAIVAKHETSI